MDIANIQSVLIPSPQRPDLPEYKHQIDLYWETQDGLALYLNIANAKWRGSAKVGQGEILLLQQVKQETGAHKAFMLTSTVFTSGAVGVAKHKNIALHIVRPNLNVSSLPENDRAAIQAALLEADPSVGEAICLHEIVHRAYGFADATILPATGQVPQRQITLSPARGSAGESGYSVRVADRYSTKVVGPPSHKGGSTGGRRSGAASVTDRSLSGGGDSSVTKGENPGFRK